MMGGCEGREYAETKLWIVRRFFEESHIKHIKMQTYAKALSCPYCDIPLPSQILFLLFVHNFYQKLCKLILSQCCILFHTCISS